MKLFHIPLFILSLAAAPVVSADVVVFGNDTVVTDTARITPLSFDAILSSMPEAQEEIADENVGSILDYMSTLFDATGGHRTAAGGSGGMFQLSRLPDGDVPINVSEFSMPAVGRITSPFGYRKKYKRYHRGVDIDIIKGDTIRAAFPGSVALTGYDKRGYGYYVILTHPNGLQTLYAHLDHFLVVPTTTVDAGTPIAIGGSSGNSTGAHLHFETRYCAKAINPTDIIDFKRRRPKAATFIFNREMLEEKD